jgi:hypothetical protein
MALGRKKEDKESAVPPAEVEPAAPEASAPAEAPAAAPPPPAPPAESDNTLLSMFEAAKMETEDLSVLTELAGDVDLSDALEDLYTVAAALGIHLDSAEEDDEAA